MTDALIVQQRSQFSAIWVVPVVALFVGLWIALQAYLNEGPEIKVTFSTAEGLVANQTKVKRLSVELGVVTAVYLNPGYNDVTATIKLDAGTESLLRDDSKFWVVRPRIGADGISGLSSILTGAHIELAPGSGTPGMRRFKGLDDLPPTSASVPGTRLHLVADEAASVTVGSPILYNGYKVGRVEQVNLSTDDGRLYYGVFVEAPYNDLLSSNTRFWNASGISINAGVDGVALESQSIETLLVGGIAFALPEGTKPGDPVAHEHEFKLYPRRGDINQQPYRWGREYLVMFDSSVRGLKAKAPVEYRGIRIGTVLDVSFLLTEEKEGLNDQGHSLVPVLLRIDPGRIWGDSEAALQVADDFFKNGVKNGLRASLASGNLISGALYVSLDFYPDADAAKIEQIGKHPVLPSVSTGIDHLQKQVAAFLDKLQHLPLEKTLASATSTIDQFGSVAKSAQTSVSQINQLLDSESTASLPSELQQSLVQLRQTLTGFDSESAMYQQLQASLQELQGSLASANQLLQTLEQKPNALVFPSEPAADLIPGSAMAGAMESEDEK